MATYFGYAEKQADSYINWAAIGKSMSDTLAEEMRIREEKKAAIDNASVEFGQELDKAPQGDHKGMNQWALEYANNAQQARLMQDKLLKSGQLSLKDYMVMRQNVVDGTSQAFDLMKEYQEEYKAKMDAYNNNESSEVEPWLMGEVEGFANFSESSLYINPTNGVVNVGKMVIGEDGVKKMSDNPNDFATVNSLRNRIKARYKRFDVQSNVGKYVSSLGQELNALANIKNKYQRGTVSELLDITQRTNLPADAQGVIKTFEQAENDMLQSLIVNPNDASSVLLDAVDFVPGTSDAYTPTWSKEEAAADPSKILYQTDPKSGIPAPVLSEQQRQVAMDYLKTQARLMYDKVEKVQVVGANEKPQRQQWEAILAKDKAEKEKLFQVWQQLRNGDKSQKEAALQSIKGSDAMRAKGLIDIGFDDSGNNILIKYRTSDGKTYSPSPIPLKDDAKQWFEQGTEVFGSFTESDANKWGVGDRVYGGGGLRATVDFPKEKGSYNYSSQLNRLVNEQGYIGEDSPTNTVQHLQAQFGDLGFSFSGRSSYGDDFVMITPKNGTPQEFNIDDQSNVGAIQQFLKANADPTLAEQKFGGSVNYEIK